MLSFNFLFILLYIMANWLKKVPAKGTNPIPGGIVEEGEYYVYDKAHAVNSALFNIQKFKEKMEILREEMQAEIIIEEGGGKDK